MTTKYNLTPVYRTSLVREPVVRTQAVCNSSDRASLVAIEMLKNSPCEQLIAIALDTQLKVIGSYVISSGTLDSSLAHPREAFRVAILLNAGAIIIAHNHPSGSLEPSGADWKVYERFKQAGELLGIGVIDSLITNESQAYSMEAHK